MQLITAEIISRIFRVTKN